jgi:hypothetical protein
MSINRNPAFKRKSGEKTQQERCGISPEQNAKQNVGWDAHLLAVVFLYS